MSNQNGALANRLGLLLILLYSVAPFYGFLIDKLLGRDITVFLSMPAIIAVYFFIFYRTDKLKIPNYIIFFFFFVVYSILSDVFLAHDNINIKYLFKNEILLSLILILIIENLSISRVFKKQILNISTGIIIIAFIVIIIQEFYSREFFIRPIWIIRQSGRGYADYRLPSIYTWNTHLMGFGMCFFPIYSIILGERLKNNNKHIIIFLLIGLIFSIFSRVRIVIVLYFVTFVLLFVYRGFSGFKPLVLITFFTIIIVLILESLNISSISDIVNYRILDKDSGGLLKGSAGTRILAFRIFSDLFPENPIFGKGVLHGFGGRSNDIELMRSLAGRSSQIHVGYLSLFYYYGILGGSLFIAFLFSLTKKLYNDARTTNYWGPFIGWLMLLLSNLTDVQLDLNIMGVVILLFFNRFYTQEIYSGKDINHE